MTPEKLRQILVNPEGLKLDFKREYKLASQPPAGVNKQDWKRLVNGQWDELIKDIIALTNGNSGTIGQDALLVVGVDDKPDDTGIRLLHDTSYLQITSQQIMAKVNDACDPPIPEILCERVELNGKSILVIKIPFSPHLHETKRQLNIFKGNFDSTGKLADLRLDKTYTAHTAFIRRGEDIFPATSEERNILKQEKLVFIQRKNETLEWASKEISIPNENPIPTNLPRSGVVKFVGRKELLAKLHEMLKQDSQVVVSAIAGMGGVGKTELALQYALAYKNKYSGGICWLYAQGGDVCSQLVLFGQTYFNIIPPNELDLIDQLRYCWRNWSPGEVLLVFDDVTDYGAITPYLPPITEPRFKTLITTRLQLGPSVNHLELNVLDEAAALVLLESLAGSERIVSQLLDSKRLSKYLGYLPLALELAGRYLYRKKDLSIAELQQRLREKQLDAKVLCQTDAGMTAKIGVAESFQLSWESLSVQAKQLGYLLSCFATVPFSWSLVVKCVSSNQQEILEEIRDDELINLHLLERTDPEVYRLHPLIREFFQKKDAFQPTQELPGLNPQVLRQRFWQVMASIAQRIPENLTQQNAIEFLHLIPHLESASELEFWQLDDDKLSPLSPCSFNDNGFQISFLEFPCHYALQPYRGLGIFYEGQGDYHQAEIWYTKCLQIALTRLIKNHSSLAAIIHDLVKTGNEYECTFTFDDDEIRLKAGLLPQHLLPAEAVLLSNETPYLAPAIADKIRLDYENGDSYKSGILLMHSKVISISLESLAVAYLKQGRSDEAEPLLQNALAIHAHSKDKEAFAVDLHNLAKLYRDQSRHGEAQLLYSGALAIEEGMWGVNHPKTALTIHNLAELYRDQKAYDDAEKLFKKSLEIKEKKWGGEHSHVAYTLSGLATLYRLQGDYEKSEDLIYKALNIWKKAFGDAHPLVGRSLDNLGMLQAERQELQGARVSYLEALGILKSKLGEKHPWTRRCQENLERLI